MTTPVTIPVYYDAVTEALKKLSWVNHTDSYPEEKTQIPTTAVFFSIANWQPGECATSGQTSIDMECELYVVCDRSATIDISRPAVFAQSCAADLTQWIDGHQFGLKGLKPAVFTGAEPDEFDPHMDDYVVWRVTFTQSAAMGADPFESLAPPMNSVWLGKSPDIGSAHVDDYRLIYRAKEPREE